MKADGIPSVNGAAARTGLLPLAPFAGGPS